MAKTNVSNSSQKVYVCLGDGLKLHDLVNAIENDDINVEIYNGSVDTVTPVIVVNKKVKQ